MLSGSPAFSSEGSVKEAVLEVFGVPGEEELDADPFDKQDWSSGGKLDAKAESRCEESRDSSDDSNEASAEQHGARVEQQEASNAGVQRYSTREWKELHKETWAGQEVMLGQGSYGTVCLGMLTKTGKLTAVKRYKEQATTESRYKEVYVFDLLHVNPHANVLRAIAVIMEESIPVAVASEHYYETLDARWKKLYGIISALESTHLLLHAAQGLSHIHSIGCAHRDVKPQNMLINYDSDAGMTLVICDFGLTKKTHANGELTTPGLMTWPYRPPEMELLRNEPYEKTCDTWSLGVVARELYTGSRIIDMPRYSDVTTLEHAAIVAEVKDFSQHVALESSSNFIPLRAHVVNRTMTMDKQSRLPWKLRTCQVEAVSFMLKVDATKRPTMKEVELSLFRVQRTLRRTRLWKKTSNIATPQPFAAITQAQEGLPKEGKKRCSTEEASAATGTEMEK
jgi:serine/threonine protein kinase